jgi:hypothetical protein
MSVTEYALLALVIVVPLVIAGAVTAWSIDQRRYRPRRRPAPPPRPAGPGREGTTADTGGGRNQGDAPSAPA